MAINPITLKLHSNIKLTQNPEMDINPSLNPEQKASFGDHMLDAVHSVSADGHAVEALSDSNDATELAMAMDQFLVELSTLKALVEETKQAIDRVFNEAKS